MKCSLVKSEYEIGKEYFRKKYSKDEILYDCFFSDNLYGKFRIHKKRLYLKRGIFTTDIKMETDYFILDLKRKGRYGEK